MATVLRSLVPKGAKARPSMEAAKKEFEVEIYLRGYDIEQIRSMSSSHEFQEQWGIFVPHGDKNAAEGSVRVRKTETDTDTQYVLAIKVNGGDNGKDEDEYDVEESAFKMFRLLAIDGLIKMRYVVPFSKEGGDQIKLECDVFYDKDQKPVEWLKIDAEGDVDIKITESDIPFHYDEIIIVYPGDKQRDPELKKRIGEMYNKYFRATNAHI